MTKAAEKTTSTLTPDTAPASVAEAKAKVQALAQDEVDRYRRLGPKKQELFEAQQAQDFQKAAVIREEVEYLADAESGRQQRRAGIVHLHALQAAELEENATVLESEVADRKTQADTLYGKLEDLEGDIELRARYRSDRTRTRQLEDDAAAMRQKAQAIRHGLKSNSVLDYGCVHGMNAEELVDELLRLPEVMGPPIASIHDWVDRRKGLGKYGQRMNMVWYGSRITELEWDGIILTEQARKPGDPGTVQDIKRKVAAKVAAR